MRKIFLISILLMLPLSLLFAVDNYVVKVLEKRPHDSGAYTQGLFFHGDDLYETTGLYGESSIRKVDLRTGDVRKKLSLSRKYFGEGSCMVDGRMYVLTWKNMVAFVYDAATLRYEKTVAYQREGWGLASIPQGESPAFSGAVMVASDGSSNLYFLDGELRTLKTLKVNFEGRPLRLLNELEWIDGKIWANVYTTDMIVVIDPSDGKVVARVDCSSLIPQEKRTKDMDVLNGIAAKPREDGGDDVWLTGKNWPWMFRVRLVPSK